MGMIKRLIRWLFYERIEEINLSPYADEWEYEWDREKERWVRKER